MPKAVILRILPASILMLSALVMRAGSERPNIMFITTDDLGLDGVSHYFSAFQKKKVIFPTPNIDALVKSGMRFADGYSSTALYSPTHYRTMSGNHSFRSYAPWGIWGTFLESTIEPGQPTLGTGTRDAGCATAFLGKWHPGSYFHIKDSDNVFGESDRGNPDFEVDVTKWVSGELKDPGFEYSFTLPSGIQEPVYTDCENGVWSPFEEFSKIVYLIKSNAIDPKFVYDKSLGLGNSHCDTRKVGQMLGEKVAACIGKQTPDEPFFRCYWSPNVRQQHSPQEKFDGVKIAGQTPTSHLDSTLDLYLQMKMIVDALKKSSGHESDLILFSSYNGGLNNGPGSKAGQDSNGGLRGNKNQTYEGPTRVSFLATWPWKIKLGTLSTVPVAILDVLATIAVAGTKVALGQAMDCANLLPLLADASTAPEQDEFQHQGINQNELINRQGDSKLIIQSDHKVTKLEPVALFDLASTPLEQEHHHFICNPAQKERADKMFKRYMKIWRSRVVSVSRPN